MGLDARNAKQLEPLTKWRYARNLYVADRARSVGDWPRAYKFYGKSLKLVPGAAPIWVQSGHAAKEMGDFAAAERAYETAMRLQPANIDVKIQLGHLLKETGRQAKALAAYKAALAAGSTDIHAVDYIFRQAVIAGDAAREAGQFALAISSYREAVEARPELDVFMHMGGCYRELGLFAEAVQAYRFALELQPGYAEAQERLEHVLAQASQGSTAGDVCSGPEEGPKKLGRAERNHPHLSENVWIIRERLQNAFARRPA